MSLPFLRGAAALAAFVLAGALHAQAVVPPYVELAFPYDSGNVVSPSGTLQVVASTTVRVQGAAWLQLHFRYIELAGDPLGSGHAIVRITSHADGAVQELDAEGVRQWRNASAYFNGNTVELEILSSSPQAASRVILRTVSAGHLGVPLYSQCGPTDDRVASNDRRCGRLMPTACTGWVFSDCMHSFLTAGHCAMGDAVANLTTVEFNVPQSLPGGAIQHPSPDDQYPIDPASFQVLDNGVGHDFCYFGCFPNSNTGLTPFQAQGAAYVLAATPPAFDPAFVMRVTGFGTDSTPLSASQTQQTSTGAYYSFTGSTVRYEVDTEGGNSGSPIEWDNGGGEVIGIHTHGGCTTGIPSGANYGTGSNNPALKTALANPLGVCAPTPSATSYCTAKVNSQGCTPVIAASGTPSETGGPGSFAINASQLINQTQGLLFYGYLPAGAAFDGGFKCVAAPTHRMHIQATGGSSGGPSCTGSVSYDVGARIASGIDPNLICGAIVYAQVWSRDSADPFTTNLTAGVRFVIGP